MPFEDPWGIGPQVDANAGAAEIASDAGTAPSTNVAAASVRPIRVRSVLVFTSVEHLFLSDGGFAGRTWIRHPQARRRPWHSGGNGVALPNARSAGCHPIAIDMPRDASKMDADLSTVLREKGSP